MSTTEETFTETVHNENVLWKKHEAMVFETCVEEHHETACYNICDQEHKSELKPIQFLSLISPYNKSFRVTISV